MTVMQTTANDRNEKPKRSLLKRLAPLFVVAGGLLAGYALGLHEYLSLTFLSESRDVLRGFVAQNPVLAPLGFAVLYALAVAFSFPAASILTLFAGFLFGWLLGGALVAVAATIGASAVFLAARGALSGVLAQKIGGRVSRMARGFEDDAFNYLLVLRLAPIFPFWVVNIAPALFNVSLRTYATATFLGILPGTFAYAYLGHGLDSVLVAAAEAGREVTLGDLVTPQLTLAFGALALVAAIPVVVKKLRRSPDA
ncbi:MULTISPECIES: TVP38/TMEM64 family protein [Alphaproteobacteria]|uniref:TVP38/TMEM64 family protein n=1 Tax=Alphaproteobacteria TaxID=28211 RepID=UPI0019D32292|nr:MULTISPECIES: TVP38/TMEM64 family protein [Alphaproteobacteria]MBY6020364.1 TVP38/TMEM64 family protein [Nitratireductor sp. DP7N14-4]MBN7755578.1 TVP38/TMEM64 family protein [Nitratireductor aquimarinus]MBN7763343.1 TVP38/TMEM64 family protein [Nitratireductor aquibiodomus]MCV0352406.1 TVP38/TMEM64 family protein [Nitratireductor sp.]MCV0381810.1 TVP38/TMEM64 family protein [Nitratireductor sp.]